MEQVMGLYLWLQLNGATIVAVVLGMISVAEGIVRLTPTKTDDGAVERVGKFIRNLFDILKVPNRAAGGGQFEDVKVHDAKKETGSDEKKAS